MSSDSEESDPGVQVRISLKLASSVQDRSLEVPTEPIAVPADIGRKGLSAVLNHLLGRKVTKDKKRDDESEDDEEEDDDDDQDGKLAPITFEFIMAGTNNRLLRKGVEKEARQYGISLEEALSITYFPATTAPDLSEEQEQLPDWVSRLAYSNHKDSSSSASRLVCSGCYDGTMHLFKQQESGGGEEEALEKLQTVTVATGPMKALAMTRTESQSLWIAAASLDHSLSLYQYSQDDGLHFRGHCTQEDSSAAISCLDFQRNSSVLASGDGKGTICLWNLPSGDGMAMESSDSTKKKKQKTTTGAQKTLHNDIKAHITMESAHSQLISGLSWGNHTSSLSSHLISGSWDHSIKLWDVEKQDCLLTLNGSRVVSCLDTSYHTEGVVATGHPDCTIRLWDVRINASQQSAVISDSSLRPSHKAWVSDVRWNPSNAYQLASTSHDGTVKLWDIRSSNPLHTVRVFTKDEKGLCLVWAAHPADSENQDQKLHLFAGGTDCIIKHLQL